MATIDQIRAAMHRAPFRGFQLRLEDGRSFRVPHPDFVSVPQNRLGRDVVYHDERGGTHHIDHLLIVEVEEPAPEPASAGPDGAGGA
jgi:hypothetical protein